MILSILPMQWTGLADLPDVPPVGDGDLDCLAEVRDVLARHGKLNRLPCIWRIGTSRWGRTKS